MSVFIYVITLAVFDKLLPGLYGSHKVNLLNFYVNEPIRNGSFMKPYKKIAVLNWPSPRDFIRGVATGGACGVCRTPNVVLVGKRGPLSANFCSASCREKMSDRMP